MDDLSLLVMPLTLFRKTENEDGDVTYIPISLSDCFIRVVNGIKFSAPGMYPHNRDTSLAVVPISSLSSIDEVLPSTPDNPLYGGSGVIKIDDFIAYGTYTAESYTVSEISVLPQCFCIKQIHVFDFSSIPCFLVKGE